MSAEIILGLGIASCLFGWIIYLAGLKITAMAMGATIGMVVTVLISFMLNLSNPFYALIVCLPAGILLGLYLSNKLHRLLFFLTGSSFGSLLASWILTWHISAEPALWEKITIYLITIVLGGFLAVYFSTYIISFVTVTLGTILINLAVKQSFFHPALLVIWGSAFLFQILTLSLLKKDKK